jgi:hypothetical protein
MVPVLEKLYRELQDLSIILNLTRIFRKWFFTKDK